MAKKRRKKRSRGSNPKKRVHRRKKHRRTFSAPKRRTHKRRARRSNPVRKRRAGRRRHRNPIARFAFKKKRHGRRRRRNPGLDAVLNKDVIFALAAGGLGFVGALAAGYYATSFISKQNINPLYASSEASVRNRNIAAVGLAIAGVYFAAKKGKPLLGISFATGSLLGAFGGWLTTKVFTALPGTKPTTTQAVYGDNMSGVYADNMSAVMSDNLAGYLPQMSGMGDYAQIGDYSQIGAVQPAAPWTMSTPFDRVD